MIIVYIELLPPQATVKLCSTYDLLLVVISSPRYSLQVDKWMETNQWSKWSEGFKLVQDIKIAHITRKLNALGKSPKNTISLLINSHI